MASKTAGGLEKITIAFEPELVAYLQAEKAGPGHPSYAVTVRRAVHAQMQAKAEQDRQSNGAAA